MSEEISLFEKLTKRFESRVVQPWGKVTIIPNREFQKEWIPKLEAQGMKVFCSALGNEMYFFVRPSEKKLQEAEPLSNESLHEEASSETPTVDMPTVNPAKKDETDKKITQKPIKQKTWTEEEIQLLKKLYIEGVNGTEISRRLKKSVQALGNFIRYNISAEMKILRKEKVEALYAESRSMGSKRKHAKSWKRDETLELIKLLDQGKSVKQASKILGRSVKSIAAKMKYLPSSPEVQDPEKPIKEAAEDPIVKEYLSACSILYPSHPRVTAHLLREASNRILKGES